MSLIDLQNVEFSYSDLDKPAVTDVNFSVTAGEFIGIIGANGSGKSTLAKLLNVLILPTRGKVFVDGMDTGDKSKVWDIRQKIGMVFQNPDNQLVATMVEDDIAFGPENLGIPSDEIRRRVDRALRIVDMEGYQRHEPHKLSGGQKQRVAIAGVLAMEPSCIVLDEPNAMLDPRGRKEVMKTIYDLNKNKNITIIHITHHMEEIVHADRIFVMHEGRIIQKGTPGEVFSNIEKLKSVNLAVPEVLQLALSLRKSGCNIPDVLSIDELVNSLC
ncbi:MAG: energy-coupling factor transporter ATPase [Bacillota bacterium]